MLFEKNIISHKIKTCPIDKTAKAFFRLTHSMLEIEDTVTEKIIEVIKDNSDEIADIVILVRKLMKSVKNSVNINNFVEITNEESQNADQEWKDWLH